MMEQKKADKQVCYKVIPVNQRKGTITVFLSMILLLVLALVLTTIENARVMSAVARGKMVTKMALESCFSSYAKEVFEQYGVMVLWKSETEFLQEYHNYIDKNIYYAGDFQLKPKDFLQLHRKNSSVVERELALDRQGELLEQQITDYMKYALAEDVVAGLLGETKELSQSKGASEFHEQMQACNDALMDMEASVEDIHENIEVIHSVEIEPEEVLTVMKQKLEEIRRIPVDNDEYNREVRDSIFHLYKMEFRKYYEWQTKCREAYAKILLDTGFYCDQRGIAEQEVTRAGDDLALQKEDFSKEIYEILEGEITQIKDQILNDDVDTYGVMHNREIASEQKKIVDRVSQDMSEILEEMWNLDYSGNKLYIYDPEGEFIEKMYRCVSLAKEDIKGYRSQELGVNYVAGATGRKKNELVEFVKKIKKNGVLSYVAQNGISDKSVSTQELPSTTSHGCSEKNWNGGATAETTLRKVLLSQYVFDHFVSYTGKGGTCLDYEVEYILAGNSSDQKNLSEVVEKLILVREGFNFVYLMQDSAKKEEAYTLAVTIAGATGMPVVIRITQFLILGAWSYAESIVDVKDLLSGYRIPVLKKSEDWNLSLSGVKDLASEGLTEESEDIKKKRKGLNYEDYLRGLLISQDRAEQVCRIADLIQLNMCADYNEQFRLGDCIVYMEVDTEYEFKRLFTHIGFVRRRIRETREGFEMQLTSSFGY